MYLLEITLTKFIRDRGGRVEVMDNGNLRIETLYGDKQGYRVVWEEVAPTWPAVRAHLGY